MDVEESLAIKDLRAEIDGAPIGEWDRIALQELITERLALRRESEGQLARWVRISLGVTIKITQEEAAEGRQNGGTG